VTFFDDVMVMTSLNDIITTFLKFDFVTISFKNHYLAKSRNFRSLILRGAEGGKPLALGDFGKFVTENRHNLDMPQRKFSHKV